MPHRGPADPLLKAYSWTLVKAYWRAQRQPCAVCGGAIDYDGPRRRNPAAFDAGHIVGRDIARRAGWTDAQINALSNSRPEHARCNRRAGARYGNRKRGAIRAALKTTRQW